MRIITALLMLFIIPALGFAQKTVTAASIIESINNNQPVNIQDATITGDLDFTSLNNKKPEQNNSKNKEYISTVNVPVNFTHCTFTGAVRGYFNPDYNKPVINSSTVYNANFEEDVRFTGCIFEKDISFKYSVFNNNISFEGSRFNNDAEFKYTNFKKGPLFKSTTFKAEAVFKYVEFPAGFDFSNAVFESSADFKYAQFKRTGSFANTSFKGGADFKYATLDDHKTTASELVNK